MGYPGNLGEFFLCVHSRFVRFLTNRSASLSLFLLGLCRNRFFQPECQPCPLVKLT